MIHLPPPIPTPGRLLPAPVRRRVLPARTPRLWLPRWPALSPSKAPALSPSKWRRPDARAMAVAFKSGHPLFKNGKLCFGCCAGCGCTDLYATPGDCSFCAACTPRQVQLVFSGVVTVCANSGGSTAADWSGATLAASVLLAYEGSAGCVWSRSESPGTTFNNRGFSTNGGLGSSSCTGTLASSNNALLFVARVQTVLGVNYLNVRLSGILTPFSGRVAFADCFSTHTVNNGTDPTNTPQGGSGGSVTVTFCP